MFDLFESTHHLAILARICTLYDCVDRATDGLTEDRLDLDQWAYAHVQMMRAKKILDAALVEIVRVRVRRLESGRDGRFGPQETDGGQR